MMSTPSVDLSSYRDQHFKVSRKHLVAAYATNPNLKNCFFFFSAWLALFRVLAAIRRSYYEIRRHSTLEIYHFTQPKSKFTNFLRDAVIFGALSWVWINTKRRRAASASSNTIHGSTLKTLCDTSMVHVWMIESCVSIGTLDSLRDDNMVEASRAAKCVTNIEPISIRDVAATANWLHQKLHQIQAIPDKWRYEYSNGKCVR